jgi:hypothetical protein
MMKTKSLIFILIIVMASSANAEVISVITSGYGSMGNTGIPPESLVPGETIAIAILLNYNQYDPVWPSYEGYFTDSVGLDLEVSGPGTLDILGKSEIGCHSGFGWTISPIVDNGIAMIAGGSLTGGIKATDDGGGGPGVLIWNLLIHGESPGNILIDLTLQGPASRYSPYTDWTGLNPYPEWQSLLESDLGDLVLKVIPEPTTIALLGLGGLMLMRKK